MIPATTISLSLLLMVAQSFLSVREAKACSLASMSDAALPLPGATLGPRPVLLTHSTEPWLLAEGSDEPIAVVAEPTFEGLQYPTTSPVTAWRPASPLAAGRYRWFGGWNSGGGETFFFVDPALEDEPPDVQSATFHVTLSEPEGDSGCDSDSCSDVDFTQLEVKYSASPDTVGALIELTADDARLFVFARGSFSPTADPRNPDLELNRVFFWDGTRGFPSFKKLRVCVTMTAVSPSGTLGERLDLGCAQPGDEGPHLTDERGCTAGQTTDPWMLVLAILLSRLFAARRHRLAPMACKIP